MKEEESEISRREFIRAATLAAFATALPKSTHSDDSGRHQNTTRVVLIRENDVMDDKRKIDTAVLERMVDRAVMTLFECTNPDDAWRRVVKPDDVVGIKSNEWKPLCTPPELERLLRRRVIEMGVPKRNVDVSDREVTSKRVFQKSTALINVRPLRTHYWAGMTGCIKNYIMFSDTPWDYHPDFCAKLGKV